MTRYLEPIGVREALELVAADAQGPLTAQQIVERTLEHPLKLKGKTPKASIQARLYTLAKNGEVFTKVGRGEFEKTEPA